MSDSPEIERKISTFSSIEDIVNAMKAYAGVTIKRTEEQAVRALAAVAGDDPALLVPGGGAAGESWSSSAPPRGCAGRSCPRT